MPWLLMGHEHKRTVTQLLTRMSYRGMTRSRLEHGKLVEGVTSVRETARVQLHQVRAHTGVRGARSEVADAFAKHVCLIPEDPQVRVTPGKVEVERDFSVWVTPVGGSRLNLGDIKGAVRDYRHAVVHGEDKIEDWVAI
jgi:hypothetical protein